VARAEFDDSGHSMAELFDLDPLDDDNFLQTQNQAVNIEPVGDETE
jgi:hypothetical protein